MTPDICYFITADGRLALGNITEDVIYHYIRGCDSWYWTDEPYLAESKEDRP